MPAENKDSNKVKIPFGVRFFRFITFIFLCNVVVAVLAFLSHGEALGLLIIFDIVFMLAAFSILFQKYEAQPQKIAKSARKTKYSLFVILAGVLLAFIVYYFSRHFGVSVISCLFVVQIAIIYSIIVNKKEQEKNCREFAAKAGYTYFPKGAVNTLPSMFTNLGDGLLIWNIFETSYQNYPVRLFDLSFRVGSGKHERVHTSTVYEMTLPQQFPLMIIAAKEGIASWVERFSSQRVERVKLEGNFNNTFTTYAESGAQMEIRVILSPDDMALLIDEMSEHSFVFSENKVFVFYSGKMIDYIEELASEEEYKKQLGQIEKVILKWLPSLLRLHT